MTTPNNKRKELSYSPKSESPAKKVKVEDGTESKDDRIEEKSENGVEKLEEDEAKKDKSEDVKQESQESQSEEETKTESQDEGSQGEDVEMKVTLLILSKYRHIRCSVNCCKQNNILEFNKSYKTI